MIAEQNQPITFCNFIMVEDAIKFFSCFYKRFIVGEVSLVDYVSQKHRQIRFELMCQNAECTLHLPFSNKFIYTIRLYGAHDMSIGQNEDFCEICIRLWTCPART